MKTEHSRAKAICHVIKYPVIVPITFFFDTEPRAPFGDVFLVGTAKIPKSPVTLIECGLFDYGNAVGDLPKRMRPVARGRRIIAVKGIH